MAHSPHRVWKGCPLCSPHKRHGAPPDSKVRFAELRWIGKVRRVRRHDLGDHVE